MFRLFVSLSALLLAGAAVAGTPLSDKVKAGDIAAVKQLLADGTPVNERARDGATPLIAAALSDQPTIAELLISKGADVMARNSGGFTPLHAAAYSGSLAVAKLLLEKGAAIEDDANKAGVTPLMVAGEENRLAVAEFLIAKGADVNHAEVHGYMPITRAVFKGNKDIIRLYKQHGATCQAEIAAWYQRCLEAGQ